MATRNLHSDVNKSEFWKKMCHFLHFLRENWRCWRPQRVGRGLSWPDVQRQPLPGRPLGLDSSETFRPVSLVQVWQFMKIYENSWQKNPENQTISKYRTVASVWPLKSWLWPPCIKRGCCHVAEFGMYVQPEHLLLSPNPRLPEAKMSTVYWHFFIILMIQNIL